MDGHCLAGIPTGLFLVALAAAVVGILAHLSRWGRTRGARLLEGVIIFGIGLVIMLALVDHYLTVAELWTSLMRRQDASMLVFESRGRTVTVEDREEIAAFFTILSEARKVSAHHSHPLKGIRVAIGKDRYNYSLSPDSDHDDEFWIMDVSSGYDAEGVTVAQIVSRNLTEYLRELQVLKPRLEQ